MSYMSRRWGLALLFAIILVTALVLPRRLWAQAPADGELAGQVFITSANVSRAPTIELQAYGRSDAGDAIDFSNQFIAIFHAGNLIPEEDVELIGSADIGTLTVFVVDLPPGVQSQLDAVQQAIISFASEPTMKEQVDYVAVFRVGETAATPLLDPVNFHNSVLNHFTTTPLTTQAGATALYDSVGALLNDINQLKPDPNMLASMVLITDGTDAVSTQVQPEEIAQRAAALGIPIHTIWLQNDELSEFSYGVGQDFLSKTAQGSGGLTARLTEGPALTAIWNRIAAFRSRAIIHYTVANLSGGTFSVELSLPDLPKVRSATTSVTIPGDVPSIVFDFPADLPAEAWAFALPDLTEPVKLSFPTRLNWLDGQTRTLTEAELVVNGQKVADLDPTTLARFEVEVPNLIYGNNVLQVRIMDEQGHAAETPELILVVQQGPRLIPSVIKGSADIGRIVRLLVMVIFLLALLAFLLWFFLRRLDLSALRQRLRAGRASTSSSEPPVPTPAQAGAEAADARPMRPAETAGAPTMMVGAATRPAQMGQPYLEILEAKSPVAKQVVINRPEFLIGRNPNTDLAFTEDITVSRIHCTIVQDGDIYRVFDEQSTGGTFVNDAEVPEYGLQLKDGDELYLGEVHLRFRRAR